MLVKELEEVILSRVWLRADEVVADFEVVGLEEVNVGKHT